MARRSNKTLAIAGLGAIRGAAFRVLSSPSARVVPSESTQNHRNRKIGCRQVLQEVAKDARTSRRNLQNPLKPSVRAALGHSELLRTTPEHIWADTHGFQLLGIQPCRLPLKRAKQIQCRSTVAQHYVATKNIGICQ